MAKINFGGTIEEVVTREEFPLNKALEYLKDETIAIIGYGVQGPGQSLNLKDNGFISKKQLNQFKKFKINKKLLSFAKEDCIFLHCLPRGKEVEEDVFLSKQSKVWQQALNRVHVQKSILLYCFGKLR